MTTRAIIKDHMKKMLITQRIKKLGMTMPQELAVWDDLASMPKLNP